MSEVVKATICTAAAGETQRFTTNSSRPKSKAELRAEKKAAKKAAPKPKPKSLTPEEISKEKIKEEKKEEKLRLKQERRKEREKDTPRGENKGEKQKRQREEHIQNFLGSGWEKPQGKKRRKIDRASKGEDAEEDETESGFRTLGMGITYNDVVVGKGPEIVQNNSLLTVRYKLTGGQYGVLIDSSKKFTFRVGKGEVIKGWEIGVLGMAVGGTRKLVIPPKAGYGKQDIGAGPGGLLFFDVSVLSCT
mmetsp:Transcript_10685/g.23640  ORF Transcript_10685/g.23640 Transcript_10685/m.23640 type:complete len:248 (-) Transcript_10685:217-960(-)|eukprot:CAMPEP_0172320556 /NCGR_PEP_ID=MMETSP1058-20130122/40796_1 /TAXON_ID=83371 /ORGANISM="Detonula confervacea, Strain CCMP 353" /LENGTH=247 /DNA_ID=CAMNT_0013035845 /DNA_START=64 /DNA_END=807 /DNA_ORIENTATION=-